MQKIILLFRSGENPTGSRDPYGARRAANILLDSLGEQRYQLTEYFNSIDQGLFADSDQERQEIKTKILTFIKSRDKSL